MRRIILDASAIMCMLFEEDGAGVVIDFFDKAQSKNTKIENLVILLPFMALMESEYWLIRRLPLIEAERIMMLLETWPVEIVESYPEWRHEAAKIKAGLSLSVADAWIASLAILMDAELIHKDPEFYKLKEIKMVQLPYKKEMK